MRYVLWAGKSGLCLFWLGTLLAFDTPLARPFALLLGSLLVLMVLIHAVVLVFFSASLNTSQRVWRDRLQVLFFGAFHLHGLNLEAQGVHLAASESRPDGGQAD